jgi:hypothetical protein
LDHAPPSRRTTSKSSPGVDTKLSAPAPAGRAQAKAGMPAFLDGHRGPQSVGHDGVGVPMFLKTKHRDNDKDKDKTKAKPKDKAKDKENKDGKNRHKEAAERAHDKGKMGRGKQGAEAGAEREGKTPGALAAEQPAAAGLAPRPAPELDVLEFPALPPIPEPWMGLPPMPVIEAPPAAVLKREQAVRIETGLQPNVHHDQVRFTIGELERTALAAQQEVIRFVATTADDTGFNITELAKRIPGAVASAEKWLSGQIENASSTIQTAYQSAQNVVRNFKIGRTEDLEAKRNKMTKDIFEKLRDSSDEIADYDKKLQEKFDAYRKTAGGIILGIPKGQAAGGLGPGGVMNPSTGVGHNLDDVQAQIDGELAKYSSQQERYRNAEVRWQLPAMIKERNQMVEDAAKRRADLLGSEETTTRFREYSYGLFAQPAKKTKEDDPAKDSETQKQQVDQQKKEFESAKEQVLDDLKTRGTAAVNRVREQEGPEFIKNLRQTGAKMYAAMKGQAKQIRNQLASLAAPMADAYQDVVKRLPPLVPRNHFLDVRVVLPQIRALIEAARQIREQHIDSVGKQAAQATKSIEDNLPEQLGSIRKQAEDQASSLNTFFVTPAQFDFGMVAVKYTGDMNKGVEGTMAAATRYIEKVIQQKKKEVKGDKPYAQQLEDMALSFLNNSIESAIQAYVEAVDGTKAEYEKPDGPFQQIRKSARDEVTARANKVDHAVPHRSTAGAILGVLASPIGGGIYLYATRSSASDVETALGELKFPAPRAIEEYFDAKKAPPTMRERIEDRLSDSDAAAIEKLLSENAATRVEGRQAITKDAYGVFGSSREAREAVLKGMDHAEKIASPATIKAMSDEMVSELSGSKLKIAQAYLDDSSEGPGKVLSARLEESLGDARKKGDDALIQTLDQVSALARKEQGTAYVSSAQVEKITRDAIVQHAIDTGQFKGSFDELAQKPELAADLFTKSVTQARVVVPTMFGGITIATVDLSKVGKSMLEQEFRERGSNARIEEVEGPVKDYVAKFAQLSMETNAEKRKQYSNELWAIRGSYEMRRAEAESGSLSKKQTTRLSAALQDDAYFEIRRKYHEASDAQKVDLLPALKKAEAEHEQKLALLTAQILKNDPSTKAADVQAAGGAHQFLKQRASMQFARESNSAQLSRAYDLARGRSDGPQPEDYGKEIIDLGRPKLLTQVMLASRGLGTNDDLLRAAYANRSKKEIAEANKAYAKMTGGEDLEVMLGIRSKPRTAKEMAELGIKPPKRRSLAEDVAWFASPITMLAVEGPETSGDLAMELERLAKGNPENDLDRAELAALQHEQERVRGTGFIARSTMEGTSEQRELDKSKRELAELICEAAGLDKTRAGEVFGPGGDIQKDFRDAFDEHDNLKVKQGETTRVAFFDRVHAVQRNAEAYRTEIDRQEAMFTSIISAIAIVVSVALLFIPGVNVVAAGVIVALLAGAATIAVKAGMRGERYGYEEMMTDVAMTAIEAGTAALGGKLASGLGKAAAARGALAKIGVALESKLGKVGGAVAREAIVGFTGGAAKAAIQPGTWDEGIGSGLGNVVGAGFRGAAVSGISAGVSTALSSKLGSKLEPALIDPSKANAWQKLANKLGPAGTDMVRETIANTAGALTGDLVNIFIDVATGDFHGGLRDVLQELGTTAAREIFTNVARSAVTTHMRQRYEKMMAAARSRGDLSEADLRILQRAAISAGGHHPDDVEGIRREVQAGKVALEGVPASLRPAIAGFSAEEITSIKSALASPELGTPQERLQLMRELLKHPGWDGQTVARQFEEVRARKMEAAHAADVEQQHGRRARGVIAAELEGPVRRAMKDLDVTGLDRLPEPELRRAAAMIARGELDPQAARELWQAARRADPELSERMFQGNLRRAVARVAAMHEEAAAAAANREPERAADPRRPTGARGPEQAPKQRLVIEPFVGPKVESVLDIIQKRPGAKVVGLEEQFPPPQAEQQRVRAAGGEFVNQNKPASLAPGSVDEILMRFPLPHGREMAQMGTRIYQEIERKFPKATTAEKIEMYEAAMKQRAPHAETLVNYAPYALERMKPGGEMEVVFWEHQILSNDVPRVLKMTYINPETGAGYRLVTDGVVQRPRAETAPFSGHGIPDDVTMVNVVRFRKVPLASALPTGATGPTMGGEVVGQFSGRPFRPDEAGGPVRELDWRKVRITDQGVDVVEQHIRRFQGGGELEVAMVDRLRGIVRGDITPTDHDLRFYTHELREFVRYRRLGYEHGEPLGDEASYRLWNQAHTATLEDYRLREGPGALFHPEVEALQNRRRPSGAAGPEEPPRPVPALEPRTRRVVEAELADVGHAKATLGKLSDAELMALHRQAQIDQLPARLDAFRRGLSEEARAQFDELRAAGHLQHEPVDHALAHRLTSALETPVHYDDTLPHGMVKVVYEKGLFGNIKGIGIVAGPGATLGDIFFHAPTVSAFRRYEGAAGLVYRALDSVRGMVKGGYLPPGSRAYEAYLELQKLPAIIESRRQRLAGEPLDELTRLRVEAQAEALESQLARHMGDLGDLRKGRGYVAAEGDEHPFHRPAAAEDLEKAAFDLAGNRITTYEGFLNELRMRSSYKSIDFDKLTPAEHAALQDAFTKGQARHTAERGPDWWQRDEGLVKRVNTLEDEFAVSGDDHAQLLRIFEAQHDPAAFHDALSKVEAAVRSGDPNATFRTLSDLEAAIPERRSFIREGVEILSTHDEFFVKDAANPELYAQGELKGDELVLNFHVKGAKGERGVLRGKQMFEAALRHFEGRFTSVRGEWVWESVELRDNLELFDRAMGADQSVEAMKEAGFKTKTGEWAKTAGYDKIEIVKADKNPDPDDYSHSYHDVVVKFHK